MKFWLSIFLRILVFLILAILGYYWYNTPDDVFMETYDLEMPKLEDVNEKESKTNDLPVKKELESQVELKKLNSLTLPDKVEVNQKLPYLVQAPSAQWDNKYYQDACEEASMLMVNLWLKQLESPSKSEAEEMLEELFLAEKSFFGDALDMSVSDTANFFQQHFQRSVSIMENVSLFDLYNVLAEGGVVIAPFNGRKLENSNFSGSGPERHMLVITGYDLEKKEFIVNDPGFRKGEQYRYDVDVLYNAIRDYETGIKKPISGIKKNVIVVRKN